MKKELAHYFLPLLVFMSCLLIGSCATSNQSEWRANPLSRETENQVEKKAFTTNYLTTHGVSLSIPEGGRFVHVPPSEYDQNVLIQFKGKKSEYHGELHILNFEEPTDPQEILALISRATVLNNDKRQSELVDVTVQKPNKRKERDWYSIHHVYSDAIGETAVWIGREGLDRPMVYVLTVQCEQNKNTKNFRSQIDSIFSSFSHTQFGIDHRYIPSSDVKFFSYGQWRWTADVHDGLQLYGKLNGCPTLIKVYPSSQKYQDLQSFNADFLIQNENIRTTGYGSEEPEGMRIIYTLPLEHNSEYWTIEVSVRKTPECKDSFKELEMDKVHTYKEIKGLFEYQLFFGWKAVYEKN